MDDLLVGGTNDEEHLKNLEAVFKQFLKYGLRVKLKLRFSKRGLQPTDEKVKAIKEAPTPRNVMRCSHSTLRSFLRILAALSNFIPKLLTFTRPLYELLRNKAWNWTSNCEQALCDVKHALTSETVLTHYDPSLPVEL